VPGQLLHYQFNTLVQNNLSRLV